MRAAAIAPISDEAVNFAIALVKARRDKRRAEEEAIPAHIPLTFRGAQLEVQTLLDPEWMLSGPSETSKTSGGLWRLYTDAALYPYSRWVILRKVAADLDTTVLETWADVVARRGLGVIALGGERPRAWVFPNAARVYAGGMDRPGRILSGNRDGIYACQAEEFSKEDWEHLSTRTTGRGAVTPNPWLGGDCNPAEPTHFLLHRSRLKMLESRHVDNPSLFTDDGKPTRRWLAKVKPALDALTGVRKLRLGDGKWAAREGVIFDFDRAIHLIPRFDIPASWRRFRTIDFGFTNPFTCQWWAMDGDGRLFMYREIYRAQRLVQDHAADIKELSRGETISATLADAADAEGRATLAKHGVPTIAASKGAGSVKAGIELVMARLRSARDKRARMFVLRDSLVSCDYSLVEMSKPTDLVSEIAGYAWEGGAPRDEDNHACDAMRYLVTYLDGKSEAGASVSAARPGFGAVC